MFGISSGLVILGIGGAIIYAYTVRFMAISTGGIEAGFGRISPSLDHAARMLGQSATGTFRHVHLPLTKAALAAAGLLVFVDCMKELPATLLLQAAQLRNAWRRISTGRLRAAHTKRPRSQH